MAAFLSLACVGVHAQSLGEAARREQERRLKNKDARVEVKTLNNESLKTVPRKEGTPDREAGGTASSAAPADAPGTTPAAAAAPERSAPTEVDGRREAARPRLESAYERISALRDRTERLVAQYQGVCETNVLAASHPDSPSPCTRLFLEIGLMGLAIGAAMEDADEIARTGWLLPGDVRAVRERHGMDRSAWDRLAALARKYRR
jgi:hypothetical protein